MKFEPVAAHRPPFVFWASIWLSAVAFILVATAYDIFAPRLATPPGRDFSNLWVAGKLALSGDAYRAFDPDIFRLAILENLNVLTLQNYSYPPHALFLAAPFALLPYGPAFVLWSVASVAVFVWAVRPYVPFPAWLAVLTPAACFNVWNGHYGLLLGALWLVYFRNLETRPIRSGLAAAAMTFKPHMGLFIAITALSRKRALLAAILGTLGLILLSALIFGASCWFGFIDTTVSQQTAVLTKKAGDFYFRMMPSAYAAFGRGPEAVAAHILFAGAAIVILARNWRVDPFLLATATFLIVPYVFVYDMTVACLGFAILLWREWGSLSLLKRAALTLGFFAPDIGLLYPPAAPLILLGAFYVQARQPGVFPDPVRAGRLYRAWRDSDLPDRRPV